MADRQTLRDILARRRAGREVTHAAEDLMKASKSLAQATDALRRQRIANR
jgi:hypothetical protein